MRLADSPPGGPWALGQPPKGETIDETMGLLLGILLELLGILLGISPDVLGFARI